MANVIMGSHGDMAVNSLYAKKSTNSPERLSSETKYEKNQDFKS